MSQKDLNEIIGLNADTGFNGIFTPRLDNGEFPEQITTALTSYSVSGIYTNVQQKLGDLTFRNLMKYKPPFKYEKNSQEGLKHRNYSIYLESLGKQTVNYEKYIDRNNNLIEDIVSSAGEDEDAEDQSQKFLADQFLKAFKDYVQPMGTAIQGITDHSLAGDVVFKNLGNLTDNVSYLFMFIIFPILIVSLVTIVYLLIKDLENVLVIMKLLGFGNKENSMPVIIYLVTMLLISSFIGSIAVPFVIDKYVSLLFNSQAILLPLSVSGNLMLGVLGVLGGIYLLSILRSYKKIKGIYLPVSIKLLVGTLTNQLFYKDKSIRQSLDLNLEKILEISNVNTIEEI
ncbi:hypothetical protein PVNG_02412 [Plasmodium vivax North Korean]|uniref:Uncharacterized protein n=1 Tax=Plasmodium vivax North Korean TaxID=1035514 RepID=A0A0J9TLS7_PLAVI|nr:hypothetical protein PVNG_02412 [Plasmodium vivax North Korean]